MPGSSKPIWLATGLRTPFVQVDGAFAERDSLSLSVPVVQAVKELAAMPAGSRAVVSICSDGGLGTVALLER